MITAFLKPVRLAFAWVICPIRPLAEFGEWIWRLIDIRNPVPFWANRVGPCSRLFSAWQVLAVVLVVDVSATRAAPTQQQLVDYAKNTWELTDLTDDAIIQTLNSSYSGIPFKDYVSYFLVAPDILNPLASGDYKTAGKKAADFAAAQSISFLLKEAGLSGVAAPAELAVWPIEHSLNAFYQAVAATSFKKQMALYFEAREFNSYSDIVNLSPVLFEGVLISKSDDGWLFKNLSYLYGSVPGYTPAQFFEYAEFMWQASKARASYEADQATIRDAFRAAALPQRPVITQQPQDAVIASGQSVTLTVAANGTGPFQYVWELNGTPFAGPYGASFGAAAGGQYAVTVYDANNLFTKSRLATVTVNSGEPATITAPVSGATVSGSLIVRASAIGATKLEFYLDGIRQFTDTASPFAWTWNTATSTNASHALTAKAYNGTILLGVSAVVNVTVSNTVTSTDADDYEPNDSSLQAASLTFGDNAQGRISSPTDVDWFKVIVTTTGVLTFNLTVPAGKDYDLELYGGANPVFIQGSYGDTGEIESISYNATTTGTYYVRVYGYPVGNGSFSTTANYSLTATLTARKTGTVVAWGGSGYDTGQTYVPAGLSDVVAISAGLYHSLALKADGTVVAWGAAPINGWIADSDHGQASVPPNLTGVIAISAGMAHSMALKADGTVVAWGSNYAGETIVPDGLTGVTAIAAGDAFSMALQQNGTVVAWGWNGQGQTDVPIGLNGVKAIATNGAAVFALKEDGTVVAWGPLPSPQTTPGFKAEPANLNSIAAVSAGAAVLYLKTDGTVVGWGKNYSGEATPPADLAGVTAIAAGGEYGVALKTEGTVVTWGYNGNGQTDVPAGLSGVVSIAAGGVHTLALVTTPPPGSLAVTAQPVNQTAVVNGAAHFDIGAAGTPSPRVRWQRSTDGGVTWNWVVDTYNSVAGSITGTLSLTGVSGVMNGQQFRCIVANGVNPSLYSNAVTLTVTKANQSIDFVGPGDRMFSPVPFTLAATATSGLPVTFSVVSGPATIAGSALTMTGIGPVVVRASQSGNSDYFAAEDVGRSFTVSSGFVSWQETKFTADELSNTNISGPNAVYGLDGLPNLVKYALGLEPKQNITSGLPGVSVQGPDWVYTYARPSSVTDVSYEVEVSTDLTTWTPAGVTHEIVSSLGGVETWRGRYPLASADHVYFRLKVTL